MQSGKLILQPIDNLNKSADEMKVLGHPVRLRILDILKQGEFAVYEISNLCDVSPPVACEHLKLLKRNDILESKRRGKAVYYSIMTKPEPEFLKILNKLFRKNISE